MDKEFTHIEPTDTCKQAAVHYMEDCQEVDDFVRRGIDEIAERYFCKGYEQAEKNIAEHIKLAYGKVSMNPFDCSEAFEELLKTIGAV